MRLKLCLLVTLVVVISRVPALAQDSGPPLPPSRVQSPDELPNEDPVVREHRRNWKRQCKRSPTEREAQLKKDTEKLLQLSTELKQYVEKTNENVLSVDVIKKAEEIEKLAHSVKEKMRGNN